MLASEHSFIYEKKSLITALAERSNSNPCSTSSQVRVISRRLQSYYQENSRVLKFLD